MKNKAPGKLLEVELLYGILSYFREDMFQFLLFSCLMILATDDTGIPGPAKNVKQAPIEVTSIVITGSLGRTRSQQIYPYYWQIPMALFYTFISYCKYRIFSFTGLLILIRFKFYRHG